MCGPSFWQLGVPVDAQLLAQPLRGVGGRVRRGPLAAPRRHVGQNLDAALLGGGAVFARRVQRRQRRRQAAAAVHAQREAGQVAHIKQLRRKRGCKGAGEECCERGVCRRALAPAHVAATLSPTSPPPCAAPSWAFSGCEGSPFPHGAGPPAGARTAPAGPLLRSASACPRSARRIR